MSQLIEIFLPSNVDDAQRKIEQLEKELVERFGGVTLYVNSPARGLWDAGARVEDDTIVVAEVMVEELDREWWVGYRAALELSFDQDEILIRATPVCRL